jgi:hypothetical protein
VDSNDFTFTLIVTSNPIGGNELFGVQNQQPEQAHIIGETKPISSVLTRDKEFYILPHNAVYWFCAVLNGHEMHYNILASPTKL